MKTLLEIALMSERTSSMDPEVRKTFSQVNRFLQGNVLNRNYGTLKPNLAKSLSDLDDNDKERFVKIIKSLTLLTSGNVAMVRDFGKSWSKEEASNWDSILSQNSDAVLKHLGFDTSQEVTARDYYEAGWHLEKISGESNIEFVGSRFDNPDFEGNTGLTQKGLEFFYKEQNQMDHRQLWCVAILSRQSLVDRQSSASLFQTAFRLLQLCQQQNRR